MAMYGFDVSHYQNPVSLPWAIYAASSKFVIIRATYGTYKDPSTIEHVKRARDAGLQIGLYAFFRSTQLVTDQIAAFCGQASSCGYKAGDIAPAIDIEDDPKVATISPAWDTAACAMTDGLIANFGEAMVYITQRDFGRLGKPDWVLKRPLWVAHYTSSASPATPGNVPYAIWQHRVGPYVADGAGGAFNPMSLDQDRAVSLPLSTRVGGVSGSNPPPPNGDAPDHSWEELRAHLIDGQVDMLNNLNQSRDV